jgi:preprotein translocase subunit SecF
MKKINNEDFGRFDFVGKVGFFGGVSLLLVVLSLAYISLRGIPYGIDFAGGTEIQIKFQQAVPIDEVRSAAEGLGLLELGVQAFGGSDEFILRFQTPKGTSDKEANEFQNTAVSNVKTKLQTVFANNQPEIRRVDSVGPQVGAELKRSGFLAVFYCLLVILIYVGLRFDYKFAPGAVICLFHDAVITLGVFILVGKEVNVPILAAILTLIGFSLNDTIVVFDRIRETEETYRDRGIKFVINKAINDMLGRTIITSGTTFTSALFLFLIAGGTVSDIAFAICIGIFFGTYSSIYVAAPLIMLMDKLKVLRTVPAST